MQFRKFLGIENPSDFSLGFDKPDPKFRGKTLLFFFTYEINDEATVAGPLRQVAETHAVRRKKLNEGRRPGSGVRVRRNWK